MKDFLVGSLSISCWKKDMQVVTWDRHGDRRKIIMQETIQIRFVTRSKAQGVAQHFWLRIGNVPYVLTLGSSASLPCVRILVVPLEICLLPSFSMIQGRKCQEDPGQGLEMDVMVRDFFYFYHCWFDLLLLQYFLLYSFLSNSFTVVQYRYITCPSFLLPGHPATPIPNYGTVASSFPGASFNITAMHAHQSGRNKKFHAAFMQGRCINKARDKNRLTAYSEPWPWQRLDQNYQIRILSRKFKEQKACFS